MARGSGGFVAGVVAGSVVVAIGLIGLQFLPERAEPVTAARDRLMAELEQGVEGVDRALPKELRGEDCEIATRLEEALGATVRPPIEQGEGGGPYDYETQELRIDSALGATGCRRLGRVGRLDVDKVRSLSVVRRLVGRALAAGQVEAARGWSVRLMALGLDLEGAAPITHGTVGAELAAVGALAMSDVAVHPSLDVVGAAKALVLVGTLDGSAPSGAWLIDKVATDRMRRGLGATEVTRLTAAQLDETAGIAAGWWRDVGSKIDQPGVPIPARPTSEVPEVQVVLDLLTDGDIEALVEAHRASRAARIGAVALIAAKVRAEDGARCGAPWRAEAPLDPLSGRPATWDASACTLTLGESVWTLGQATPPVTER